MKFKDILPVIILFAFIGLLLASLNDANKPANKVNIESDLSKLSLNSIYSGNKIQFPIENQYIVVIFSSWCKSCKFENKQLLEFSKLFPSTPIYGFLWMDSISNGKKFLEELGNPYKNVAGISDIDAVELGATGIPEIIVVGRKNKSILHIRGETSAKNLAYMIQELKEND